METYLFADTAAKHSGFMSGQKALEADAISSLAQHAVDAIYGEVRHSAEDIFPQAVADPAQRLHHATAAATNRLHVTKLSPKDVEATVARAKQTMARASLNSFPEKDFGGLQDMEQDAEDFVKEWNLQHEEPAEEAKPWTRSLSTAAEMELDRRSLEDPSRPRTQPASSERRKRDRDATPSRTQLTSARRHRLHAPVKINTSHKHPDELLSQGTSQSTNELILQGAEDIEEEVASAMMSLVMPDPEESAATGQNMSDAEEQDGIAEVKANTPNNITSYPYLKIGQNRREYIIALRGHLREVHAKASSQGLAWRADKPMKPLMWLHVHKEAGTFVCLAAVVNGEKVVAPSRNCNWKAYDIMWSGDCNATQCNGEGTKGIGARFFKPPSCSVRARYFQKWNFTFGAIERELHSGDICPEFRYGTALRRPLLALESKVYFETKNLYATAQSYGVEMPAGKRKFELGWFKALLSIVFDNPDPQPVYGLPAWKFLDNFKVRIILGDEAFNLGPGQVEEQHVQLAIARLETFNFVKILDTDDARWDGTATELGWGKRVAMKQNSQERQSLFDEETTAYLLKLNKYDQMLFDHFDVGKKARARKKTR